MAKLQTKVQCPGYSVNSVHLPITLQLTKPSFLLILSHLNSKSKVSHFNSSTFRFAFQQEIFRLSIAIATQ